MNLILEESEVSVIDIVKPDRHNGPTTTAQS